MKTTKKSVKTTFEKSMEYSTKQTFYILSMVFFGLKKFMGVCLILPKYFGRYAFEKLLESDWTTLLIVCVVAFFLLAYFYRKIFTNKYVAWGGIFLAILLTISSYKVFDVSKELTNTEEALIDEQYSSNRVNVSEVFTIMGSETNKQKQQLLCKLIAQSDRLKNELLKSVLANLKGWMSFTKFDKKEITYNAILYADSELFKYLLKEGVLDLSDDVKYSGGFSARRLVNGYIFPQELTPLELAKANGRKDIIDIIKNNK